MRGLNHRNNEEVTMMGTQRVVSKCKVCGQEIRTGLDTVAAFCDKCVKVQEVDNPAITGEKEEGKETPSK